LTSVDEAEFQPNSFDVISFGAVLEHLYYPSEALSKAIGWLRPGGLVYAEVPSASYLFSKLFNAYFRAIGTDYVVNVSPMHVPYHLYEFTEESFARNGRLNGYDVVHIDRYVGEPPVAAGLSKILSPVMRATRTGLGLTVYMRRNDKGSPN
jgi:predicted SAM-dependent methyltransferase